ncbi:MAG: dicarboxylate/amino acid:cation symporter, partial [Erysipelotrichales bacterium]
IKNYGSSLILLGAVIIGGVCGVVFGEKTAIVKPIGDLFLNLMFITIVPLVFFSISSAIASSKEMGRIGNILKNCIIVFLFTIVVSAFIGYFGALIYNPLGNSDIETIKSLAPAVEETQALSIGEMIVNTFSVGDFKLLFDKGSLLPLIIFTVAFGVATTSLKEKGQAMADWLQSGSDVILKIISYVMKLAPLGLGSYFAYTIGSLGSSLISGFIHAFILYMLITVFYFFIVFSIYAYLSGGMPVVKVFWKNNVEPSLTAIATSSSAACIPVSIVNTKRMGVPDDIAETAVPLGTNIHKDGSVISGIVKIVFIMGMYDMSVTGIGNMFMIIGIALLAGVVVGAIPSGGATGEILMLSLLGLPMSNLGILMILATIMDIPATLLNATGQTISTVMVARLTEGKDWLKKSLNKA